MSAYDLHFNKDLSFFRKLIIGVLDKLNGVSWLNQVDTDIEDRLWIDIPFYFGGGSERFLNDLFLNPSEERKESKKAETYYNQIPRGIIELKGIGVDSQAITNKYVRTEHVIEELDGTLNTYSSETMFIPLNIEFDVTVHVDSVLDQLKATELIFKAFFKALPFNFEYNYSMIPAYISFPDDIQSDSIVEFSFDDKKEYKITFSIEVKCSMPVYKEEHVIMFGITDKNINSRFFVGNTMAEIANSSTVVDNKRKPNKDLLKRN